MPQSEIGYTIVPGQKIVSFRQPVLNKGFQNWNFLVLNMATWLDNRAVVIEY
jgi:hypothetical protein